IEPLPFSNPDRIVAVWEENVRQPGRSNTVGPANFLRWSERNTTFERMAALAEIRRNLTGNGAPEELTAQVVTAGFFTSVLGVPARVGRTFTEVEERNPDAAVAVLSDNLWRRRFGGDPSIVGRTIQLNGTPTTVVGVMPPGFQLLIKAGALVGKPTDVWLPYVLPPEAREPRGRYLTVVARLKSGVS